MLLSHRAASENEKDMISSTQIPQTKRFFLPAVVLGVSLLTGCATVTKAPEVPEELATLYPSNIPKGTITNFNAALACVDNLMLMHEVSPVYVSAQGISNYTSDRSLSSGGIEMLITALSKMSIRSNGVRFVNYNSDIANMMTLQGVHPDANKFRVPDYFIRGGVTQHNKTLWTGQRGRGASVELKEPDIVDGGTFFTLRGQEDISASDSLSSAYGTLTMDMSAGFIPTLQIVPGVASANTLALQNSSGEATNADLTIGDIGYTYTFSENTSLDFNQLYRSLIQVGSIEIIGKLQQVPYWKCLSSAGDVAERDQEIAQYFLHFKKHDKKELLRGAQRVLSHLKYYDGAVSGVDNEATQEAIQSYQQHMGLLATGRLDYTTFRMMKLFTPSGSQTQTNNWWRPYEFTGNLSTDQQTTSSGSSASSSAGSSSSSSAASNADGAEQSQSSGSESSSGNGG